MEIIEDALAGVAIVALPEGFVVEEVAETAVDGAFSDLFGGSNVATLLEDSDARELTMAQSVAGATATTAASLGGILTSKSSNAGSVYDPKNKKNAVIVYDPYNPTKTGNSPFDAAGRARRAAEAANGCNFFGIPRRKKKKKKNRVYMC